MKKCVVLLCGFMILTLGMLFVSSCSDKCNDNNTTDTNCRDCGDPRTDTTEISFGEY